MKISVVEKTAILILKKLFTDLNPNHSQCLYFTLSLIMTGDFTIWNRSFFGGRLYLCIFVVARIMHLSILLTLLHSIIAIIIIEIKIHSKVYKWHSKQWRSERPLSGV